MMISGMLLAQISLSVCCDLSGQSFDATEKKLDWWNDIPGFLNEQHRQSLATVDLLLRQFPPALEEPPEHRAALLLLDNVLHEPEAAARPSVQTFFVKRIEAVGKTLQETKITKGARIWKLYNDGFIVRTASATVAFDVVTGKHIRNGAFVLPGHTVEDFAQQCDALFISHAHPDHADPIIAEAFVRHGKAVMVPEELWKEQAFSGRLLRLRCDASAVQVVSIKDGAERLSVVNGPGHQGEEIPNNVVIVTTSEDLVFAHTGDQSNQKDFEWLDTIAQKHRVDVLMPNCWAPDLPRMIAGFQPAVVIPGHENELDHPIDHREPYWLDRIRLGNESSRAIFMTWGESFDYMRQ